VRTYLRACIALIKHEERMVPAEARRAGWKHGLDFAGRWYDVECVDDMPLIRSYRPESWSKFWRKEWIRSYSDGRRGFAKKGGTIGRDRLFYYSSMTGRRGETSYTLWHWDRRGDGCYHALAWARTEFRRIALARCGHLREHTRSFSLGAG